jgi:hypothetical protein
MKYISLITILCVLHAECICQSANSNFSAAGAPALLSGGFTRLTNMVDPGWRTETMQAGADWSTFNGIKGNPFYNDTWQKGYIILQGNKVAKDVMLNFNIYNNNVYYFYDSQSYVLDESAQVKEFGCRDKEDSNKITVFRCGYPSIENNNEKTFYEIVIDDKISLFKHYSKAVVQHIDKLMGTINKELFDEAAWYVYDKSDEKIIAMKKNKNAVEEALPAYKEKIKAIIDQKKLNLKVDSDWVVLFQELNK